MPMTCAAQDILQLPDQQDVYAVIQSLLRSKTTLKVWFCDHLC